MTIVYRTGVVNSQWAGECGESTVDFENEAELIAFIKRHKPKSGQVPDGCFLSFEVDPSDGTVTAVECIAGEDEVKACGYPLEDGAENANGDRFVVERNGEFLLCYTRYWEPMEEDSNG